MDKNTIIAFILIGLILIFYVPLMRKLGFIKSPTPESKSEEPVIEETIREESPETVVVSKQLETFQPRKKRTAPFRSKGTERQQEILDILETDLFRSVLSSRGGGTVLSWQLKKYTDSDGNWVKLVSDSAYDNLNLSLSVRTFGEQQLRLSDDIFQRTVDSTWAEGGDTFHLIRYTKNIGRQSRIEKEYLARNGHYDVQIRTRFVGIEKFDTDETYKIIWNTGLQPTEKNKRDEKHYYQVYGYQGGDLLKTKAKPVQGEGTTEWAAIRNKYFLLALISEKPQASRIRLGELNEKEETNGNSDQWKNLSFELSIPFQQKEEEQGQFTLFIGPMDYGLLKGYDVGLDRTMSLGMPVLRPFSIGAYYALQFLYSLVHNYGLAIIIFSILIKVVLYPLTRKSFQSMRQMQELQPQMTALREKYKKDPQRMNQETMKLYKEYHVNPMGGCLPMLLQMPVLFALFNLFRTTIMLRQASFLGIKDLSAPDNLLWGVNLLPLLMGVSMLIQQKLSMKDPKQKAMVYMMPIFLTYIFYKMSAGLNLYYLMFNLLTIAQEMVIRKHK